MFEIKRRKLGAVYTTYPAQLVGKWIIDNVSKLIFAILISVAGLFVLYVITGVVNFVGGNVANFWARDLPTLHFYNQPYMMPLKIIIVVAVFIYVFKNKTNRKR